MSYAVKEMYHTLQGEGANAGRAAVFCRFAGCNLWSGREADRPRAVCQFCDTDFVGTNGPGGGAFADATSLADAVEAIWQTGSPTPDDRRHRLVVCTGGEPLLQLDEEAVRALRSRGFAVAVETNGTRPVPPGGVDWLTVSPKSGAELVVRAGSELKLVYPQAGAEPSDYEGLAFRCFYLQPLDGPNWARHTQLAVAYCLAHPQWRLSLQTHKLIGLP